MSFDHKFAFAFAAGILMAASPAGAKAWEVAQPATASTVDLGGGASALTYWVDDADGRHVVTSVDTVIPDETGRNEDRHSVVRFSAVLLPGQIQTVSVPSLGTAQPQELQLRRSDKGIEIDRVSAKIAVARNAPAVN
jgi:hypothetical protein